MTRQSKALLVIPARSAAHRRSRSASDSTGKLPLMLRTPSIAGSPGARASRPLFKTKSGRDARAPREKGSHAKNLGDLLTEASLVGDLPFMIRIDAAALAADLVWLGARRLEIGPADRLIQRFFAFRRATGKISEHCRRCGMVGIRQHAGMERLPAHLLKRRVVDRRAALAQARPVRWHAVAQGELAVGNLGAHVG